MAAIEAIATTYLEADTASVTFSSLGSYEHLQDRASLHGSSATVTTQLYLRPNGDTSGINWFDWIEGYGTTEWSDGRFYAYAYQNLNEMPMGVHAAAAYATWLIDIFDYRNTNKAKTLQYIRGMQGINGAFNSPTGSSGPTNVMTGQGVYYSTDALTSLVFLPSTGSFARGSSFTVYGLNSS